MPVPACLPTGAVLSVEVEPVSLALMQSDVCAGIFERQLQVSATGPMSIVESTLKPDRCY